MTGWPLWRICCSDRETRTQSRWPRHSQMSTIAEKSLELTSLFEAEVLVQLMLRHWRHPLADDGEHAHSLLENAAEALRESIQGVTLIQGVPPSDMNLIAAVWYVEDCTASEGGIDIAEANARRDWLTAVRRALPSCFCDPSDLEQP
jgi:hypothetical protein